MAEHKLESTWVLWEHKSLTNSKNSNDWLGSMRDVCEFSTVEVKLFMCLKADMYMSMRIDFLG
jgi:hypothetical protein